MTNGYELKNKHIKGKIKLAVTLENMYLYLKSGLKRGL